MTVVYIFCLSVGLFFALVSALLSGLFGGDHGGAHAGDVGEVGGAHADIPDGDFGGDAAGADVAADGGHEIHLSPLSPLVLCLVLAGFGAAGLILEGLFPQIDQRAGVPAAVVGGLLLGALGFYVFGKILSLGAGTSAPRKKDLIGLVAEVTTTIPVDGIGGIAYTVAGTRYTAPARSLDTLEIKAHTQVTIERTSGNVFVVKPLKSVQKGK